MKNDAFPTTAMVKKYIVDLSVEERAEPEQFSTTGKHAADQSTSARILLKTDCNPPRGSWLDKEIAAALDVGVTSPCSSVAVVPKTKPDSRSGQHADNQQ